jgi:hypothetical protein
MTQAEVRHGQEIRADLPGIRVTAMARDWFFARRKEKGEVFFCNMGPIRIREVKTTGDAAPLPEKVLLEGLEVPNDGTYDLLDVLVQSNGDLRVIVDNATRVVPVRRAEMGRVNDLEFV